MIPTKPMSAAANLNPGLSNAVVIPITTPRPTYTAAIANAKAVNGWPCTSDTIAKAIPAMQSTPAHISRSMVLFPLTLELSGAGTASAWTSSYAGDEAETNAGQQTQEHAICRELKHPTPPKAQDGWEGRARDEPRNGAADTHV